MKTACFVILHYRITIESELKRIAAECHVSVEIESKSNGNGYHYCIVQGSLLGLLQFSNATGFNNIRLICKNVN